MGSGISLSNMQKKKLREEDQGRLPGGGNPGPNDEMGLVRRRGGMKEKGFSFGGDCDVCKSLRGQIKSGSGE